MTGIETLTAAAEQAWFAGFTARPTEAEGTGLPIGTAAPDPALQDETGTPRILDVLCRLGRLHGHPSTPEWIDSLRTLSSRTGMRELTVRALLHAAALGDVGAAEAAGVLAEDIENPVLSALVYASRGAGGHPG